MMEKFRILLGSVGMEDSTARRRRICGGSLAHGWSGARLSSAEWQARPAPSGRGRVLDLGAARRGLLLRGFGRGVGQAHLAGERVLVPLEHEVDPFADVHRYRHFGAVMQEAQLIAL